MNNCRICNYKIEHFETPANASLFPFTVGGNSYTCKCPVYFLEELSFMQDNGFNFQDIGNDDEKKKFIMLLQQKKDWLKVKANTSNIKQNQNIDVAMAIYNKQKQVEGSEPERINRVIWRILYGVRKGK